jgi:mono/diheme cytochrome c family protein
MRYVTVLACVAAVLICAACSGTTTTTGDTLPAGDASHGAALFTQSVKGAPACSTCHTTDGSALVGPSLKGFSAVAGTRVEGMSGADYAHNSIVNPASYVVSGFANLMYAQYAQQLSPLETADLIAYLMTL